MADDVADSTRDQNKAMLQDEYFRALKEINPYGLDAFAINKEI